MEAVTVQAASQKQRMGKQLDDAWVHDVYWCSQRDEDAAAP